MNEARTSIDGVGTIGHDEAMRLAGTEYSRLLDVVAGLDEADWTRPTDCEGWDVKALLCHVLGEMEANATVREFVRQFRLATKDAKHDGPPFIDHMTARQLREHAHLSVTELADHLQKTAPKAHALRRRAPAFVRALRFSPGPPFEGRWSLGYLLDVIINRDNWMHRIDLTRATDTKLVLTREHDGRIVANVVAEWARAHRQPFSITLDGPAGGTFVAGKPTQELRLDAIEFCRILSGRAEGSGLLSQQVAF